MNYDEKTGEVTVFVLHIMNLARAMNPTAMGVFTGDLKSSTCSEVRRVEACDKVQVARGAASEFGG